MYENIIKKLLSAETVAIFMHINPDGDCVGSALSLYAFLKNMGKDPYCYLEPENNYSHKLSFLPNIEAFSAQKKKKYDLGIAVDCGAPSRLGTHAYQAFLTCKDTVCIDHHETGEPFSDVMVLEPKAAATCQILYKIMQEAASSCIDKDVATCLYSGILTDSGGFSFSSTTEETFLVAAKLSTYGINVAEISKKLFKNVKKDIFRLTNRVLNATQYWLDGKVGVITFRQEDFDATDTERADTEGIINRVIDINEVSLAISVAEVNETTYKIGIRAKEGIDAGACACYFGGGGHRAASGCRIYGSLESVYDELRKMAEKFVP